MMLNEILEEDIVSIQNGCNKDINSVKYVASVVDSGIFNKRFKNHSEKEIYSEMKTILNQMYQTYPYYDRISMDNVHGRVREDIEKSLILGLEQIRGNEDVLDGYFDTGEILSLTELGKDILNKYRLARGELTIEDYKKELLDRFYARSQ